MIHSSPSSTRRQRRSRQQSSFLDDEDEDDAWMSSSSQNHSSGKIASKLAAVGLSSEEYRQQSSTSKTKQQTHSSAMQAIIAAEEVEDLINDALGSQLDETAVPPHPTTRRPLHPLSTTTDTPSFLDMVSVTVVRAWDLQEALGSTNPYIVVDWGIFGRSTTQTIASTTTPRFGSYLRFKSPFRVLASTATAKKSRGASQQQGGGISIAGERYQLADCPMIISAYSRNESVSDELLGSATLRRAEILRAMSQHLQDTSAIEEEGDSSCFHTQLVVSLRSTESQAAGSVELILSLDL
jgi:hypothetical protein